MQSFVGERRAVAAAILAFYAFLFLLVALAPPPGWGPCFAALALVYGVGFFGLVAGYFWARWFAVGLGLSGLVSAAVSMFQVGPEPVLLFYGATHAIVSGILWGGQMALQFDGRKEWRERFHLDENATHRLGKAIMRVGMSLPYVVMYALAPREGESFALLATAGAVLAVTGTWALLRMRSWGVVALAAAAAAIAVSLPALAHAVAPLGGGYVVDVVALGAGAAALLAWAAAPFAAPLVRYVRGRSLPAG